MHFSSAVSFTRRYKSLLTVSLRTRRLSSDVDLVSGGQWPMFQAFRCKRYLISSDSDFLSTLISNLICENEEEKTFLPISTSGCNRSPIRCDWSILLGVQTETRGLRAPISRSRCHIHMRVCVKHPAVFIKRRPSDSFNVKQVILKQKPQTRSGLNGDRYLVMSLKTVEELSYFGKKT